jgi:hypothetical protein
MSIIGKQSFQYLKFTGRTTNAAGLDVATYAPAVTLRGSVQAVPRSVYQNMGLDFQKNYVNIYVSQEILDITRDVSGDKISFNGKLFLCLSKTAWYAMDGWDNILCVEIPNVG